MKQFFYIAGLPRSGSTVLCAILNQNPNFHVSATSPLSNILYRIVDDWQNNINQTKTYNHPEQLRNLWLHVQEGLYAHVDEPTIFDKGRAWHMSDPIESHRRIVGAEMKVICLVDSIPDILASFIRLVEMGGDHHNFIDDQLRRENAAITTENRCKVMLRPTTSSVGWCFQNLKQSFFSQNKKNLYLMERSDLVTNPKKTLRGLYQFIKTDYYPHEFTNLTSTHEEDDQTVYGIKNLHKVEPQLYQRRYDPRSVLGEQLYQRFSGKEFWRV